MKFILSIFFLFATCNVAQAQNEVCRIKTFFRDLEAHASSGIFQVGEFSLLREEEQKTKLFLHQESGVSVVAGVERVESVYPNEKRRIKVALSFTREPADVYDLIDGAEAESVYDKHWKWLSVSNNIKVKNRIYTFIFSCESQKKNRNR